MSDPVFFFKQTGCCVLFAEQMFFTHQIKSFFPLRLQGAKEVNIVTVVSYALKYYKMRVAGVTLRTELKSHPDYPSLLSVCDTFDSLEVEYRAVKTNIESLQKIDHPFLSFLSIGRGLYVFVLSVNSREVSYTTGDGRIKIVSLNEFSAGWSGAAVFIHKPAKGTVSGKIREYQKNYQSEKFNRLLPGLLLIIFFCVLLYRVLFNTGALHFMPPGMIVLSATKSLGLFFSLMLYRIELNAGIGRLLYRFCHLGPKINCHSVLNSKVSTLWSEYGLAEAGISYFYKRRSGNTSLQFVFSSMENPAGHILFFCLYYYAREGMLEAFEKLINNWYAENKLPGGMDMDAISYTESTALKVQNINSKEFMRSGITKVPVVCVNGFVLPDIYAVEDLPYLLDKIKCEAETIINGK